VNGRRRVLRLLWRRLTSMRTAIVLLFLLALAAVPGSLLPQRPLNPAKVRDYLAGHGAWGRFLDRIGAFDVFGSYWFTAIYLLLFISLIGCLVPRISVYARALRAEPIAALYEQGRVSHVGDLAALEDEMMLMTPTGYMGERSPNRVDAAVWAITEAMLSHMAPKPTANLNLNKPRNPTLTQGAWMR